MCQIFPPFSSKVSEKKVGWRKDFCDGKSDGIGEMAENWRKMTEKRKVLFFSVWNPLNLNSTSPTGHSNHFIKCIVKYSRLVLLIRIWVHVSDFPPFFPKVSEKDIKLRKKAWKCPKIANKKMAEKKSKMAEKNCQSGGGKILKHGHYEYLVSSQILKRHSLNFSVLI